MSLFTSLTTNKIKKVNIVFWVLLFFLIFISSFIYFKTDIVDKIKININLLITCSNAPSSSKQIDCIYKVVENEIAHSGINAGMNNFLAAYGLFESFRDTKNKWCHYRLHSIGDIAYYNMYKNNIDISQINFPENTTACTYGFFHGFLEHLIQDNPYPEFANNVCNILNNKLDNEMSGIRKTCYHATGHGFMYSQGDILPIEKWSNFFAFIEKPIEKCSYFSKEDRLSCWSGIFDIILTWANFEEYGFSSNQNLVNDCEKLKPEELFNECYFTLSLGINWQNNKLTTEILSEYIKNIKNDELKKRIFRKGISGIVWFSKSDGKYKYKTTLAMCEPLENYLYKICIDGIIHSLFGLSLPQKEYVTSLNFCSEPAINQKGMHEYCYQKIIDKILTLYTKNQILNICSDFPTNVRKKCEKLLL